jgi:hypothetical protein
MFAGVASLPAADGFLDLPLAWLIPAAIRCDVAAGFVVSARCAADDMDATPAVLVAGVGSWTFALPTRERRSGLEVKYLQEKNERGPAIASHR